MTFTGFIENITEPKKPYGWNCYYGLNVSGQQQYEPVDQLDGFFVAKAIQNRYGGEFYPYIAGVYGVFDTTSPKRAKKAQRMLSRRECEKKDLLEDVMRKLELDGKVITTYELWGDPQYWKIFKNIAPCFKKEEDGGYWSMPFGDFPKEVLGAFSEVVEDGIFDDWDSCNIYTPAEVAEAIYLNKYGVGWKLGPLAEERYDQYIRQYGIGIIQFRQPKARTNDGDIVEVCPYISKENERWERIFLLDKGETLVRKCSEDNPSYLEVKRLTQICRRLGVDASSVNDALRIACL